MTAIAYKPEPRRPKKLILLIAFFTSAMLLLFGSLLFGQACSCGAPPLMGSMELPATAGGIWQIGFTYEFNSIADVVTETVQLKNDSRKRKVHSGLLEISYGISDRLSLTTILSLTQKERESAVSFRTRETLTTRGFGDGLVLLKYSPVIPDLHHTTQVSIGGGLKFPLGKSSLTTNQLLISADMQPGTGSLDGVFWFFASRSLYRSRPINVFAAATYRLTGANDRFDTGSNEYKFGNELLTTVGVSQSAFAQLDYSLAIRYRTVSPDRFNDSELPNSGGKWLNAVPGLNFRIGRGFSARTSGEIPIYRNLNGTQLTTTYTVSFTLFYSYSGRKQLANL